MEARRGKCNRGIVTMQSKDVELKEKCKGKEINGHGRWNMHACIMCAKVINLQHICPNYILGIKKKL